jgi:energy-coupling factor transporter transmembrane protein EcfT
MTDPRRRWWLWPVLLVLLPVWLLGLVLWLITAVLLLIVVWVSWCPRRRYALVVYSNSPVWQEYFQTHVLPAMRDRGVVLNWSERNRWTESGTSFSTSWTSSHR